MVPWIMILGLPLSLNLAFWFPELNEGGHDVRHSHWLYVIINKKTKTKIAFYIEKRSMEWMTGNKTHREIYTLLCIVAKL
jgi:hypothetical protein